MMKGMFYEGVSGISDKRGGDQCDVRQRCKMRLLIANKCYNINLTYKTKFKLIQQDCVLSPVLGS